MSRATGMGTAAVADGGSPHSSKHLGHRLVQRGMLIPAAGSTLVNVAVRNGLSKRVGGLGPCCQSDKSQMSAKG